MIQNMHSSVKTNNTALSKKYVKELSVSIIKLIVGLLKKQIKRHYTAFDK